MTPIFVNGRFLCQQQSGVQRFAVEITAALCQLIENEQGVPPIVLVPTGVLAATVPIRPHIVGARRGNAWEQFDLPRHAARGVLVNLGNTASMVRRSQIVVIHDTAPLSFPTAFSWRFRLWYRLMQRIVVWRGARVATVSDFAAAEIERHLGVPAQRISVLGEGADHMTRQLADTSVLARLNLTPRRFVLAAGNLAAHKNLAALGASARMLADMGIDLVVTGAANAAVFKTIGVAAPEPAHYVGRVSDAELRALYDSACCFVFPSLYEGFGLPAIEAMACGCPVVASDIPPHREILGEAAHIVDPHAPEAIARGVRDVVTNDDLAAKLRRNGAALTGRLTWAKAAARLLAVIRAQTA